MFDESKKYNDFHPEVPPQPHVTPIGNEQASEKLKAAIRLQVPEDEAYPLFTLSHLYLDSTLDLLISTLEATDTTNMLEARQDAKIAGYQ